MWFGIRGHNSWLNGRFTAIHAIIVMFIIMLVVGLCTSCNNSPVEGEVIYVPVQDTVTEKTNIARIVALEYELKLTRDTLNLVRDSIGEDLFIANYKLGRIKRYNEIAAKGNNIKYLRGWINRVLNE